MEAHSNRSLQDITVLQMVREDMAQLRESISAHQRYAQEEFRRLHDKLEEVQREVRNELQSHDRDIVKLAAAASMAGRVAGFVAGALSGLVAAVVVAALKHFVFGG